MTVQELAEAQQSGRELLLLDVRTDEELEIAAIPGHTHVPLHELEARVAELDAWRGKEVVCMCHHGGRSAMAQQFLEHKGFTNVKNLVGGIHQYAEEIDDSIPIYG
jgi:rhodanese-related sulfurtransferase